MAKEAAAKEAMATKKRAAPASLGGAVKRHKSSASNDSSGEDGESDGSDGEEGGSGVSVASGDEDG